MLLFQFFLERLSIEVQDFSAMIFSRVSLKGDAVLQFTVRAQEAHNNVQLWSCLQLLRVGSLKGRTVSPESKRSRDRDPRQPESFSEASAAY